MSSSLAKLNLRPHERRLVVIVGLVLFAVVNVVFVWPYFGEWHVTDVKLDRARKNLALYRAEIAKVPGYKVKLRELQAAGSMVVPEEQELDLVRTINNQAQKNNLNVIGADTRPHTLGTQTNQFFEEQYMNLHVTTGNEDLVNFLVSLTSSNSLIRVKELRLKPDPGVTKLDANMTVVASYQRKAPAKTELPLATPAANVASSSPKTPPARNPSRTNKANTAVASASTNHTAAAGKTSVPTRTPVKARLTNQPAKKP